MINTLPQEKIWERESLILSFHYAIRIYKEIDFRDPKIREINRRLLDEGSSLLEKYAWPIIKKLLTKKMAELGMSEEFILEHLEKLFQIVEKGDDFPDDWPMDPEMPLGMNKDDYNNLLNIGDDPDFQNNFWAEFNQAISQ
ncbi:MAG: hypothetical protein ABIM99_03420 [Candidatus Dojkabacteria bacterium]